MTKNKTVTIATLFLIFAMAFSLVALSTVNTVTAKDYETYARITAAPNPVGVGQIVTVVFFLSEPSPTASAGFNPAYNWNGYTVKVTSPSDKTSNYGPYTSDATGGAFFTFTPDEVGDYTFDFSFPGQTVEGINGFGQPVGPDYYGPSSASTHLTVQQEPIAGYQTPPLPTSYWTRPIYGENRGWYEIGGDWLMGTYNATGPYNPYTTAPNTAHILWTKQQYIAGVVGGDYGDLNYYQAPTYQPYWVPPIIISGRLYYMERQVPGSGWVGLHCVDIRTGKELWFRDVEEIGGAGAGGGGVPMNIYGQVFDAEGVNGHGAEAFIWNLGADWTCFDANSGNPVYTITNPFPSLVYCAGTFNVSGPMFLIGGVDPAGSIIAYYMDGVNDWLLKWNSTLLLINSGVNPISNLYLPPKGKMIDWSNGIQWNVTIPHISGGAYPLGFYLGTPKSNGDVVFATTADICTAVDNCTIAAYSGEDGHELWVSDLAGIFTPGSTLWEFFLPVGDGVLPIYNKDTLQMYGFDAKSGAKLWGPTQALENAWDTFLYTSNVANGKLYTGTFAGKLYCHDLKTGNLDWTYTLPSSGYDTPYGTFPLYGGITIADGKLYTITGEHTPNSPYWLGGAMYCVNVSTGDLIYKISGWWCASPAIADGYALDHNSYDGTIYCFGKGQTGTTVSASPKVSVYGDKVMIEGSVMDQSPGATDYAGNRLNEATPAIADEYMTEWMEYLYQQKPKPANATGVEVTVSVLDPNNNVYDVGTTTSDSDGFFKLTFEPLVPGEYTVIATFAGSESYWGSMAKTAINVEEAPAVSPSPTPEPASMADLYLVPSVIGIIVAIVVVGVVIILMLRKR